MIEPIDRLETMEQLANLIFNEPVNDYFRGVADAQSVVAQMPEVKSVQWTPCSERMPRDDEEVIVNIYDDSGDTSFSYTTVGWHYKGLWIVDDERCLRVTAWMPLPAPYKGDTDGK